MNRSGFQVVLFTYAFRYIVRHVEPEYTPETKR